MEKGLDAFIVSSLHNIRYLTGFSGSSGLCIVRPREAIFITDSRYTQQSRAEVKGFIRKTATSGLVEAAARNGSLKSCKKVGFESHCVSYAQYRTLKKAFPFVSFVPTLDVVETLSLVKDAEEIRKIQEAVAISDKVFGQVVKGIRPGVKELDIAAEISYLHKKFGAEQDAFEPVVASGTRGSWPHARPTSKRIKNGDLVTLDFGCTVRGYNSDITRTVAVGRVSRKSRDMYDVVLDAQCTAIAAARGGMLARDLDAVARKRISAAGYGKYFIHSLGHGIGLHVHERPRVSALSREQLLTGSVITIEPGVYIQRFGGVRIEDDVLLTEKGCRVLNSAPKELMIL
jgi:Xaa-Pro aminopeptidase